jgi:hypothetical protein
MGLFEQLQMRLLQLDALVVAVGQVEVLLVQQVPLRVNEVRPLRLPYLMIKRQQRLSVLRSRRLPFRLLPRRPHFSEVQFGVALKTVDALGEPGDAVVDELAELVVDEADDLVVGLVELIVDQVDVAVQTARQRLHPLHAPEDVSGVQRHVLLQFAHQSVRLLQPLLRPSHSFPSQHPL